MIIDSGSGDFRIPSFRVRYLDTGYQVSDLQYKSHRIVVGQDVYPSKRWFPHFHADKVESHTLFITLEDPVTRLQVHAEF
jgi:alpha-galactosidase